MNWKPLRAVPEAALTASVHASALSAAAECTKTRIGFAAAFSAAAATSVPKLTFCFVPEPVLYHNNRTTNESNFPGNLE